jgi:hypothetical protein
MGMAKLVLAVTVAAAIAGATVSLLGLSMSGEVGRKGDRLDIATRTAHCRPRNWPYDQGCLQHAAQPIRLVTTDNL